MALRRCARQARRRTARKRKYDQKNQQTEWRQPQKDRSNQTFAQFVHMSERTLTAEFFSLSPLDELSKVYLELSRFTAVCFRVVSGLSLVSSGSAKTRKNLQWLMSVASYEPAAGPGSIVARNLLGSPA